MKSLAPRRDKGRLKRLTKTGQRLYGAAWDDLPLSIAVRIKQLFKATGCMDVYDSPCQFLDVAIQILEERGRKIESGKKMIAGLRELIGDPVEDGNED